MNYFQKKKLFLMSIVNKIKGFVRTVSGTPPIILEDCVDDQSVINYQIYGNTIQTEIENNQGHKYQQLEYLEATGTQYIDAEFKPNNNTRIVMDAQYTDVSISTFFFGTRDTSTSKGYTLNRITSNGYFASSYGNEINTPMFTADTDRHIFEKNKNLTYVDGELLVTHTQATFTCTNNLEIFACNNGGTSGYSPSKCKIYSFKIYDNDVLIRDFMPCRRTIDGTLGLYDIVNNVFYTNKGTGTFIGGKEIDEEYKPVEYIEGTGTQYIDMQYTYQINDEIEISFMKTQETNAIQGIFGNGNQSSYSGVSLYLNAFNNLSVTIGGVLGLEYANYNASLANNTKYNVKISNNNVYLDGQLIISVTNELVNGTQSDFSLFRRYGTNTLCGRIYKFSVKRNNKLLYNLIPYYRSSDNVAGMYDLVNGKFYENNGTGAFLSGQEIQRLPSDYQEVDYIESDGTQYIDTEVIPSNTVGFKMKISLPEVTSDLFRFGCKQDSGNTRFILGSNGGKAYFGFGDSISPSNNWTISVNTPFEANLNYLNCRSASINNLGNVDIGTISIDFTYSLIMFGRNNAGSISSSAQRIYSCQISDDDKVIRDFIPCYRTSDNAVGMYDLINQVFYENKGTGTFIKGSNTITGNNTNVNTNMLPMYDITSVGEKTKNLFGYSALKSISTGNPNANLTATDDDRIVWTRTNADNNGMCTVRIDLKAGTYSIKVEICDVVGYTPNTSIALYLYDLTFTNGSTTAYDGGIRYLTLTEDTPVRFSLYTRENTSDRAVGNSCSWKVMLNYGQEKLDYEPYGMYKIPVIASGKNLFNPNITPTPIGSTSSVYYGLDTRSWEGNYAICMRLKEGKTCPTSGYFGMISSGGTAVWFVEKGVPLSRYFDTTKNCYWAVPHLSGYEFWGVGCYPSSTWNSFIDAFDVWVVKGNYSLYTLPNYEPYVEPIATCMYAKEPIRAIGGYKDCIDSDRSKIIRKIAESQFISNYVQGKSASFSGDITGFLVLASSPFGKAKTGLPYNSIAGFNTIGAVSSTTVTHRDKNKDKVAWIPNVKGNTTSFFAIPTTTLTDNGYTTDLSGGKAWVNAQNAVNPIMITYILETPTEEAIDLSNLPTFKVDTIYTINTSVQPTNMVVNYYSTIKGE